MPRLRTLHPDKNFTQVHNPAMDLLPDLESLGLLNHLLRHRDEYDFTLARLVAEKPGLTRGRASKARTTLVEYGFYVAVKFRHTHRGQFATDIYRSYCPHTDEDIEQIAQMYQPGLLIQIPVMDEAKKRPARDARGNLLQRPVTITWARIESWRGEEVVQLDGTLPQPADGDAAGADVTNEPVDNSDEGPSGARGAEIDTSEPPAETQRSKSDIESEGPGVRGPKTRTSEPPAETPVLAGGSEVRAADRSGARPVGSAEVKQKTEKKTDNKTHQPGGPTPLYPPTPAAHAAGPETDAHLGYGPTTELESKLDPDHARARKLAGKLACAAIDADPEVSLAELEKIISSTPGLSRTGGLTQAQVIGRAAKLQAFTQLHLRNGQTSQWQDRHPGNRAAQAG